MRIKDALNLMTENTEVMLGCQNFKGITTAVEDLYAATTL